ncbi:hypothetical protein SAMN04490198_1194 [Pseudomonas palleroniana]|uniref:Uncharacterized protein n=1 Tax=Pseudomonas palleroniana TaxID=191390 RepID=A0A1H5I5D6_9PSED|nr:hypothetical protein SAMN04490198_1194 [Pseudomonas palleroniana]
MKEFSILLCSTFLYVFSFNCVGVNAGLQKYGVIACQLCLLAVVAFGRAMYFDCYLFAIMDITDAPHNYC